jgi:aminocarboxymuconate-semialdehyde decarboxylase
VSPAPSCACGIDVHTHVVPENFPDYLGSAAKVPWPSLQHDACGHAHVLISGKRYRTVDSTCWDTALRIKDMDEMGLARQVLSPMPELLSYWLPLDAASQLLRHMNESIAELVTLAPERFLGLGAVPLQDVDAAVRELHFVMRDLKLQGVEIATHVNGVSIGDPRFEPFFAEAAVLGAAVFVHGLRPAGTERLVGPEALAQMVAFPGDVALAAASLVTGGMLERHPALRVGLSHGGGAFSLVLPRLRRGWQVIAPIRDSMARDPAETARRFWCDFLTYDEDALRMAMKVFGDDKVMIGTDYPFPVADRRPHATIESLGLAAPLALALREKNAEAFLGLAPTR